MIWLRFIFSPIGRMGAAVAAAFSFLFMAYVKGRREGVEKLRQEQQDEETRRLKAAIEADARGRERIARGELLQNDGYRRD
jgi:uncharacterized membrane protein